MKNDETKRGEVLHNFLRRAKYIRKPSDINLTEWSNFMKRCGISNGIALCTARDATGKTILTHAFAGSIIDLPQNYNATVEYNPKPEWSNGSDTKSIEAHLRATKKKLGYVEVTTHGGKRRGAGRPQTTSPLGASKERPQI